MDRIVHCLLSRPASNYIKYCGVIIGVNVGVRIALDEGLAREVSQRVCQTSDIETLVREERHSFQFKLLKDRI